MLFRSATSERQHRHFEQDLVTERSKLLNAKEAALSYNKQVCEDLTDDISPIARHLEDNPDESLNEKECSPWATVSVLLLGVISSNAVASLMLATYATVSSDFDDLDSGSWLLSAYTLTMCATQPLYGKLSDIYGRKPLLLIAYAIFALGNLGAGLGQSLVQVIAWRAVQGVGGAGMASLVAIIIADIVPADQVATFRGYVNISQIVGRSCGGVVGGWLTQAVGWRWAFLVQVPPTVLALVMVGLFSKLPGPKHINTSQTPLEKLKRIDFRGAFLLTTTVLSICLILDLGGSRIPWTSHWIAVLTGTAAACSASYVAFARRTPEPIFPLQLAAQPVVFKHYLLILFQAIAFNALMVYVPVYFQVASLASTSEAGMFLVPAFVGNTLGGLFAGAFIRRSKAFKALNLGALASGLLSMVSLWFFWNGESSPWLALCTFPLGFGMGALFNSVFVGLATQVQEQDVAIATSGLFLFFNLGAVAGVSGGSAVFHSALREWLGRLLSGVEGASEITKRALTDIAYVQGAPDAIRDLLVPSYVAAFHSVLVLSIACYVVALVFATSIKSIRR